MQEPKILLVSTGGTISSQMQPDGGYRPALGAAALLEHCLQQTPGQAEIVPWQYCSLLSFAMTPEMIFELTGQVRAQLRRGPDWVGAVVTQGTATMEETAFLADLLWDDPRPLVFTGAMANATRADWDGPQNLADAVAVALHPDSRNRGALVCMAGEVHAARDVAKLHKTALSSFASVNAGRLATVSGEGRRVTFVRTGPRPAVFSPPALETRVELIKICLGCGGGLIDAAVEAGARAVVLECFPGGGGIPPAVFERVKVHLQSGVFFVMAPRSPCGSANDSPSASGSGPWDLRRAGVIPAGDLPAVKARLLLMAALPGMGSREELAELMARFCP
jgi:L-asparaginase